VVQSTPAVSNLPTRDQLVADLQALAEHAIEQGNLEIAAKYYDLIAKICGYVGAGSAKPVPVDAQTALRRVK